MRLKTASVFKKIFRNPPVDQIFCQIQCFPKSLAIGREPCAPAIFIKNVIYLGNQNHLLAVLYLNASKSSRGKTTNLVKEIFVKFKEYFIILPAILFLIGCASTKQIRSDSGGDYEIRIYEAYGMDCPGCHDGVEKLLNKVPGVKNSEADWEKAEIEVLVNHGSDLTDEVIFEAVKKANFTPGKRIK